MLGCDVHIANAALGPYLLLFHDVMCVCVRGGRSIYLYHILGGLYWGVLYGTTWATDSEWVGLARNLLGGVHVYRAT